MSQLVELLHFETEPFTDRADRFLCTGNPCVLPAFFPSLTAAPLISSSPSTGASRQIGIDLTDHDPPTAAMVGSGITEPVRLALLESRYREVRRHGGGIVLGEFIRMGFNARDKLLT